MSKALETTRGHLALYAGAASVDGRTIGLQVETPPTLARCELSPKQAVALALELLERAFPEPIFSVRQALEMLRAARL